MKLILKLVAQRVALGMLLLLCVSVLIFVGTQILPGDVAQAILGQAATPEALANIREGLGLNRPAYVRYFEWLGNILTGDLGTSLINGRDIGEAVANRLGNTLFLAAAAAIIAVPLAIILGIVAVKYQNKWPDKIISGATLTTISLPEFFIGYLLIYFIAVKAGTFTSISTVYDGMPLNERINAIALPALTLTLVVLAHMMRMTRAAILNIMQSPYIETAELKGLTKFNVIRKHAFPKCNIANC